MNFRRNETQGDRRQYLPSLLPSSNKNKLLLREKGAAPLSTKNKERRKKEEEENEKREKDAEKDEKEGFVFNSIIPIFSDGLVTMHKALRMIASFFLSNLQFPSET